MSKQVEVVIKAKGIQGTKWPDLPPEVVENLDRLAVKIPAIGCLYSHPYVRKLAAAAAEAERRALEDEAFRKMLEHHGLTVDSDRADIVAAMRAEYLVAHGRFQKLCNLTLEGGS